MLNELSSAIGMILQRTGTYFSLATLHVDRLKLGTQVSQRHDCQPTDATSANLLHVAYTQPSSFLYSCLVEVHKELPESPLEDIPISLLVVLSRSFLPFTGISSSQLHEIDQETLDCMVGRPGGWQEALTGSGETMKMLWFGG